MLCNKIEPRIKIVESQIDIVIWFANYVSWATLLHLYKDEDIFKCQWFQDEKKTDDLSKLFNKSQFSDVSHITLTLIQNNH